MNEDTAGGELQTSEDYLGSRVRKQRMLGFTGGAQSDLGVYPPSRSVKYVYYNFKTKDKAQEFEDNIIQNQFISIELNT